VARTKTEIEELIIPQGRVDLILKIDLVKESIDVRPTIIYDVIDKKAVILAQTDPPVRKSMVGRQVEATFLTNWVHTGRPQRLGYRTTIRGFLPEYKLRSGGAEQALIIGCPRQGLKETSVRLHYRVTPTQEDGLSIQVEDCPGQVHLVDLSLAGMLISIDGRVGFKIGQELDLVLQIKENSLAIKVKTVRFFERSGSKLSFIGLAFVDLAPEDARLIQETVAAITRRELRAHSGLRGGQRPLAGFED